MTIILVLLLTAVCVPAVAPQLRWFTRRPHWLLLATLKRHHRMRQQPAVFTVAVDPAKAGQRRHALREDRCVPDL